MNEITLLIWITIAIIGIIAIIIVKLHYKGDELETDEESIIPSSETITDIISAGKDKIKENSSKLNNDKSQQNQNDTPNLGKDGEMPKVNFGSYIAPEVENNNVKNFEYESQNQLLINYDNTVEKFQEPIKENQMNIMTQNKNPNEKHELKDLFTIDELIKESKRKDNEREKESQKIKKDENDEDLEEIKESIRRKKEQDGIQERLIEEIVDDTSEEEKPKEETIGDLIKDTTTNVSEDIKENSDKDRENKIESKNITDTLLDSQKEEEEKKEKIKEPALKTPTKVDDDKNDEFGASIDSMFEEDDTEEMNDLDYRKDLAKITNTIKGSRIFKDVKERLTPENDEPTKVDERYIRNVNEYDEYEPIVNETHVDYDANYEDYHNPNYERRLRQENTRKVFNRAKNSSNPEFEKTERNSMKITLNNNQITLKKGDEIIFNHLGETYSSQVFAIKGNEISVKYRRQYIKIKPEDVKKVY